MKGGWGLGGGGFWTASERGFMGFCVGGCQPNDIVGLRYPNLRAVGTCRWGFIG